MAMPVPKLKKAGIKQYLGFDINVYLLLAQYDKSNQK
jgi:hypothetical protein